MAKTKVIALAIEIEWPYKHHQDLLKGILKFARPLGWRCEFAPFLGVKDAGKSEAYDGIIGRVTPQLERHARKHGIPTVNVWLNSPVNTLPNVFPDVAAAGEMAAASFLSRGYRRFGFVGVKSDVNSNRMLLEGFSKPIEARRFALSLQWWVGETMGDAHAWKSFQESMCHWMQNSTFPIAVLCGNDVIARYFAESCLRAGLRIPQDVAIMGVGNMDISCEMSEPRLSSIEFGFERVGHQAASLLEQMKTDCRKPSSTILIPPAGVVTRTSTDAFVVTDPDVEKAMRVIQARSKSPVSITDVLAEVPLSRRTLERRFREILGCTIYDEITRSHVERAKHFLVTTRHPLKWVAIRAGFSDPRRLSIVFRKAENITPREYRFRHGKRSPSSTQTD
ncbi:MAG: substrate-binding domain-containing protein [Planctomycetota bacterium]